ncbi:MAG: S1 RNA-binding domain-containing protein [Peptostreptococcaceae bacterium]|nr:S1 RNA-binding domain-containing protein [Peptostreptococcaceae bacterium]
MDNKMEDMDLNIKEYKVNDIVEGKIILVKENEIMVDISYKSDGIVMKNDFDLDENESLKDIVKEGEHMSFMIISLDDNNGNVLLSRSKVRRVENKESIKTAYENKEIVKAKIISMNKGGLNAKLNGFDAFIPKSQFSIKRVDFNDYINSTLEFNIIELNLKRDKIVLSRIDIEKKLEAQKKLEAFESLNEGDVVEGKVVRIEKFGAFVDLNGIDGLIHISNLSWGKVKRVEDVINIGQDVKVSIISLDKKNYKIGLSLKDISLSPWEKIKGEINLGDIIEGKVVRFSDYGAFINIEEFIDGFCHISQIKEERVLKVENELNIGDIVIAKIINLDLDNQKIGLSIKEAKEEELRAEIEEYITEDEDENMGTIGELFGDLFKDFKEN